MSTFFDSYCLCNHETFQCADYSKKGAWEHQKSEWLKDRMKIINAMTTTSGDLLLLGNHSSIFMEPHPDVSHTLGSQEAAYAVKIGSYVKSILQGTQRLNLVREFSETAKEFKDMVFFSCYFKYSFLF